MEIKDYQDRLTNALIEAGNLLTSSGYRDCRTLEYVDCDSEDPNDMQRWDELMDVSKLLMMAVDKLEYIRRPIIGMSQLHKNSSGRYEDDFYEYTCGSRIEFLLTENCYKPRWVSSHVEGDADGNYYIVGYKELSMEGLETRARKTTRW